MRASLIKYGANTDVGTASGKPTPGQFYMHGTTHRFTPRACCCLPESNKFRKAAVWLMTWVWFDRFILSLIIINSVMIAATDYGVVEIQTGTHDLIPAVCGWWTRSPFEQTCSLRNQINERAEPIFTAFFVIEMVAKIAGMGFICGRGTYLNDAWNWIDFVVVTSGVLASVPFFPNVSVLRTIRVLRPLRSLTAVPKLRALVMAILRAVPDLANVFIVLAFMFVIFGILGLALFAGKMNFRCRMTPYPVAIGATGSAVMAAFNRDAAIWMLDGETKSALLEEIFTNRTAFPFCAFGAHEDNFYRKGDGRFRSLLPIGATVPLYSKEWRKDDSPWKTARDCAWPIDVTNTRACNDGTPFTDTWQPTYACTSDTYCGANTDWRGNARFRDALAMARATYNPDFNFGITTFDNIAAGFLTIFQCITLEGWVDIMYVLMDATGGFVAPVIFSVLIFIGSFFLLNLTLAVLGDNFQMEKDATDAEREKRERAKRHEDAQQLALIASREDAAAKEKRVLLALIASREDAAAKEKRAKECVVPGSASAAAAPLGPQRSAEHARRRRMSGASAALFLHERALRGEDDASASEDEGGAAGAAAEADADHVDTEEEALAKLLVEQKLATNLLFHLSFWQRALVWWNAPMQKVAHDDVLRPLLDAYGEPKMVDIVWGKACCGRRCLWRLLPLVGEGANPDGDCRLLLCLNRTATHPLLQAIVTCCIVLNTLTLASDTYPVNTTVYFWLELINFVLTLVFTVEMVVKLAGLGFRHYMHDFFNIFDAAIVCLSAAETFIAPPSFLSSVASAWLGSADGGGGGGAISALRTFRVFRLFKLARSWKSFNDLLLTIVRSLKSGVYFMVLLALFVFIFALVGQRTFANRLWFHKLTEQPVQFFDVMCDTMRQADAANYAAAGCHNPIDRAMVYTPRTNFDTLPHAIFAIFQVLSKEDWNVVMYDTVRGTNMLYGVGYMTTLYCIGGFVLLDFFLAILLSDFEQQARQSDEEIAVEQLVQRRQKVALLQKKIMAMLSELDTDGNGKVSSHEVMRRLPRVLPQELREHADIGELLFEFKQADLDGDGKLDADELTVFAKALEHTMMQTPRSKQARAVLILCQSAAIKNAHYRNVGKQQSKAKGPEFAVSAAINALRRILRTPAAALSALVEDAHGEALAHQEKAVREQLQRELQLTPGELTIAVKLAQADVDGDVTECLPRLAIHQLEELLVEQRHKCVLGRERAERAKKRSAGTQLNAHDGAATAPGKLQRSPRRAALGSILAEAKAAITSSALAPEGSGAGEHARDRLRAPLSFSNAATGTTAARKLGKGWLSKHRSTSTPKTGGGNSDGSGRVSDGGAAAGATNGASSKRARRASLALEGTSSDEDEDEEAKIRGGAEQETAAAAEGSADDRRVRRRVAAALHERWRADRYLPGGSFEPRIKVLGGVEFDIANLSFENLPPFFQSANLSAAHTACAFAEDACASSLDLQTPTFLEAAAENQHKAWMAENPWCDDPLQMCPYAQLSMAEQDKDRNVVRLALREVERYLRTLYVCGGAQDNGFTFADFKRDIALLAKTLRQDAVIAPDADLLDIDAQSLIDMVSGVGAVESLNAEGNTAPEATMKNGRRMSSASVKIGIGAESAAAMVPLEEVLAHWQEVMTRDETNLAEGVAQRAEGKSAAAQHVGAGDVATQWCAQVVHWLSCRALCGSSPARMALQLRRIR